LVRVAVGSPLMKRALPSFKSFRASSGGMGASAVVRTFLPQNARDLEVGFDSHPRYMTSDISAIA